LVIAATAVYKLALSKPAHSSFQYTTVERSTETGNVLRAAISSDGKYVAYATGSSGQQGLWLRQVATHTDIQISSPQAGVLFGLTFSHDSNYIYFARLQVSLFKADSHVTSETNCVWLPPQNSGMRRVGEWSAMPLGTLCA